MGKIYLSVILLLFSCFANAQNYESISAYEQNLYGESVYVNGDYNTMRAVRAFWVEESNRLKNRNCEFSLCGNAEAVLKVTIPTRVLFSQDEQTLASNAEKLLRPLLEFVNGKDAIATCIVACHSDNNGSEDYLTRMTSARAESVKDWFLQQGVASESLSSYGLSTKVPRTKNENIRNRELNRRVTLYFVPNKQMLKLAKKGKL